MTGQFFINLLNPVIATLFAAAFAFMWRKRPTHLYLPVLVLAFMSCGAAFIAQDMILLAETPESRLIINGFFLVAILGACIAALMRARLRLPLAIFAAISLAGAAGLSWFAYVDPSLTGRIYAVNATFAVLTAMTAHRLVATGPKTVSDWLIVLVVGLGFALAVIRPLLAMFEGIDINADGDFRFSAYWITVQVFTPVLAIAIALAFLAATALELIGESRSEARTDYLSGLLNRRGFEAAVAGLLEKTEPSAWPPAILLADIDDFKKINDTFGHETGDKVIARIGEILAARGQATLVGRIGGEEFALFYADARRTDLQALAADLLTAVSSAQIPGLPKDRFVTMSIGIHTRHQTEPFPDMMAGADRALYDAKHSGKNRVVMAPPPLRSVLKQPTILSA